MTFFSFRHLINSAGEREYEETEQAIRALLAEAGHPVTGAITAGTDDAPTQLITPETYLGNARRQDKAGSPPGVPPANPCLPLPSVKSSFAFCLPFGKMSL